MGKRLRRGGGRSPFSPSVIDRSSLLRRMKSLNLDIFSEPYMLIERLRERYPDYARIKLKPFSDRINETLKSLRSSSLKFPAASSASAAAYGFSSSSSSSDGDDEDEERRSRRRRIKEDTSEERLLRAESEHLRRRLSSQAGPSSSSLEPSDDLTSTSEDAAFEEKVNLEFDVTKSMLRERYANQSALRKKSQEEVKNVEIEAVVNETGKAEMAVTRKGSGQEVPSTEGVGDRSDNVQSRGMVKEGPKFRDLGGMNKVLEELMMEVIVPLCHPELPERLGVKPVSGILLHGPPGCGKTKLAHAIANETGLSFYKISSTEVVSGVSGASEENIRDLFNKAYRTAPSIVFIDEIDAIASKRENLQREMERRIVTQLMICMDELHQTIEVADVDAHFDPNNQKSPRTPGYVLVIGATNRPDAVDQALRRPGRFDKEIGLGVPDENAREQILSVLIRNLRLEGEFDIHMIAKSTPGFVGADLAALANKAGNLAMKRILDRRKSQLIGRLSEDKDWWRHPWTSEEVEDLCITMLDFMEASKLVQPSTRREGFSSIPDVSWEDVGGLDSLRKAFDRYIVQPIKQPEDYEELGVDMKEGFILYGPPGCGKTLIAKAVAHEAGANFIHIKGPEIVRKFVGDSEQEVRMIFTRARCCSPCIIFFDEIDSLAPKRGGEGAWAMERALNQLLVELDGANPRHGVYVIGATNRIDNIDAAIMRPGRFGRVFYVPLPSADERLSILKALGRKKPISPDVDFNALACREECRNLTGADLYGLMNEAAIIVREEKKMCVDQGVPYSEPLVIKTSHFEKAFQSITPSVTQEDVRFYESLRRIRAP